jgi:hypothetical protein
MRFKIGQRVIVRQCARNYQGATGVVTDEIPVAKEAKRFLGSKYGYTIRLDDDQDVLIVERDLAPLPPYSWDAEAI